jgi:hypothetical protein
VKGNLGRACDSVSESFPIAGRGLRRKNRGRGRRRDEVGGTRGGGGGADSSQHQQQPAATTTAHPPRARLVMNLAVRIVFMVDHIQMLPKRVTSMYHLTALLSVQTKRKDESSLRRARTMQVNAIIMT